MGKLQPEAPIFDGKKPMLSKIFQDTGHWTWSGLKLARKHRSSEASFLLALKIHDESILDDFFMSLQFLGVNNTLICIHMSCHTVYEKMSMECLKLGYPSRVLQLALLPPLKGPLSQLGAATKTHHDTPWLGASLNHGNHGKMGMPWGEDQSAVKFGRIKHVRRGCIQSKFLNPTLSQIACFLIREMIS